MQRIINPATVETAKPMTPVNRYANHMRRLWVLPAMTLFAIGVLAALLMRAVPAEAQGTPNLVLIKTGPLAPVQIGNKVVYTLTVSNIGSGIARNITVTDQTPTGLVFEGFGGACSGATCNIPALGNLAFSGTRSIQVTFTISSDYDLLANPIITNTAFVTASTPDSNANNNRGLWATIPFARADLELAKQASSDVVARGENVTYTLTLTNNGPNTAFAVSVLDILTPTLPFITGTTGICNFVPILTGTIILCDNLPAGSSHIITAVHAVPLDWVTPTVVNTGLAGSISIDPNYFNNVATSTITITSRADMSITKEGPAMIVPGTDAIFTLTVKNLGPSKALSVTVDDPGFNDLTSTNAGACEAGFPCDLGTMFPNSETQIIMTFTVPASFTAAEITNTATVTTETTDPNEDNNTSEVTVPVVRVSDLAISKAAPATAVPGTLITYTVVVTNNGPSDAAEVTLTDMEPISLTDAGNPCTAGVCHLPDLPVGMSATLMLTYNIDPFARDTVTNTASVTSTGTPTPVVATALTEFTPEADVVVVKTDGLKSAAFGTPLTYTIVVTNNGPSGVAGAHITDPMPEQLKVLTWNCDAVSPNTCVQTYTNSTLNVLDVDATLAPNSAVTITVSGLLTTTFDEQDMFNTVTVTLPAGVTETNPLDNTSTDETWLNYVADIFVTKTVSPAATVAPGELVTYVVAIGNAGPSKAPDVNVYDYLPWSLLDAQWVCESTAGATCDAPGGLNGPEDQNIALEPGSFVTFTITGTLSLDARGALYNNACAYVGEGTSDPDGDNNCANVSLPIQSRAFVAISKTDGQTIAVPGTTITYVIALANEGPSNANGLVYDIFPPELTNAQWFSDSLNGAQVISDLNAITTTPGVQIDLPVGSLLTITVSSQLNLTATGWLTNVVEFAMGNESPANIECQSICGCECIPQGPFNVVQYVKGDGNGPLSKPIINTNPITRAVDVDAIVPAIVNGKIYNDLNGDGMFDAGEPPMAGVKVEIIGVGVASVEVTTDANGEFSLKVLPGPFSVSVVPGSVPAGYVLTTNNANQNGVAAAGVNATGFIGYQGRGNVRGVAFNDVNGNQVLDAGESPLSGVVVSLLSSGIQPAALHDAITTTSDANGNYAFTNVASGGYTLNAAAPAGFVNTTPLPQNVEVTPAGDTLLDLGFQVPGVLVVSKTAKTSGNGNLLGPDRLITFTLSVTNNGGALLSNVLVTDSLESYIQYVNGSAVPAPVSVAPLVWQIASLSPGANVTIQFVTQVSPGFAGLVVNTAIAGSAGARTVQSNEVIINSSPTAISLLRFTAQHGPEGVNVMWQTGFERNTFGFNLLRSATGSLADAIKVNSDMIPAGQKGGVYFFVDKGADAGVTYTYWLQEIEVDGTVNVYAETAAVQGKGGQHVNVYRVYAPLLMR